MLTKAVWKGFSLCVIMVTEKRNKKMMQMKRYARYVGVEQTKTNKLKKQLVYHRENCSLVWEVIKITLRST